MDKKLFTIDEVNALIPKLEIKITELLQIKQKLSQLVHTLLDKGLSVEDLMGETQAVDDDKSEYRKQLEDLGLKLQGHLADIQSIGCTVKDMDMGLVDFPGIVDGQEALLCWQLGEKRLAFWHGADEGFGNRRPLFEDAGFEKGQLH